MRPFAWFVALRYVRSRRRDHFISLISLISILGITLGITVLITVLSVMNGAGSEIRDRILGVIAHATVTSPGGDLPDWTAAGARIEGQPGIVSWAPYVDGQAMIARGREVSGVLVRGILPGHELKVSHIGGSMVTGQLESLQPGTFRVVIGEALARRLGLVPGDEVSVVVPQGQPTPAGLFPRFRRFTVAGIFRSDMYEYDSGLLLMALADAQVLYQKGDRVSGLRLHLSDVDGAPEMARALERKLGPEVSVRDWTREHANFFRALKIEKTAMFVILLLIVAVAMFNVVSTLVVVVTEKKSDIAILRTLGATQGTIMRIFMLQGATIGVLGTVLGVIGGVLLALNVQEIVRGIESLMGTTFLSPEIYFISQLPSKLRWGDVAAVASASLVLGLLSTLYPAWRASRVRPAEALRYE